MPSLSRVNPRFTARFEIIDGGSGQFSGVMSEPSSGEMPASQFTYARRQLRVDAKSPVAAGMVVRDSDGTPFLLAEHGNSESRGTTLFRSLRMFQLTKQYPHQVREKRVDPITQLDYDIGLSAEVPIWGAYEPTAEQAGGAIPVKFETGRFITGVEVALDEIVDGKQVTRVDRQLGVYMLTLG